jgi:hypothetical protein
MGMTIYYRWHRRAVTHNIFFHYRMRVIPTHTKTVDSKCYLLIRWKSREVLDDVKVVLLGFNLWIDFAEMHLRWNLSISHTESYFDETSHARSRFSVT